MTPEKTAKTVKIEAYWKGRYESERAWSRYYQRCYESEKKAHNVTVWLIGAGAVVILIVASTMTGGTP